MYNRYLVRARCPVKLTETITNLLVIEKYASCIWVYPTSEGKCWVKGKISSVLEDEILLSTTQDKISSLKNRLTQLLPYENPIVKIYVPGSVVKTQRVTASKAPIVKKTYKKPKSEYRAAGVAFIQDGKILLVRRGPTSPWMPGSWSLVTGGVDPGESPFQAAIRESQEEVNLTPVKMKILGVGESPGEDLVHFFLCTKYTGNLTLNWENDMYAWVSMNELYTYNMPRLQGWFAKQALKAFGG